VYKSIFKAINLPKTLQPIREYQAVPLNAKHSYDNSTVRRWSRAKSRWPTATKVH